MRRVLLALALLVIPGLARGQDLSCDAGDLEIRSVDFSGNTHFSDSELERAIVTTPSSWARRVLHLPLGAKRCLDTLEVQRDAIRLRLFYRQRGYYKTTVDSKISPTSPGRVAVGFELHEGPPVLIDTLVVSGLDSVPDRLQRRLLRTLEPFRQSIYDRIKLKAAIDSVVDRLQNNGYAHATDPLRDITVDNATDRASVKLAFTPGPVAHIGAIDWQVASSVPGQPPAIDTATIRELLSFAPGDLYRQRELLESQRDLYGLETYRHVDVEIPDSLQRSDTSLTVLVRVGESKMNSMRVGVGWAYLDCVRTQARFTDRNFLGGAKRLELSGRLSHIGLCPGIVRDDSAFTAKLNYFTSATLRLPTLFGPRNIPSLTLFSERSSEYRTFIRYTPIGLAAQVTRDLHPRAIGPGEPLTLGYRVEYGRTEADPAVFCQIFNRCTLSDIATLQRNATLQVGSIGIARDRTNSLFNPTRGSVARLELRIGATTVDTGGTAYFNRLLGEVSTYASIGQGSVVAARLQLGTVFQWKGFQGAQGFVPPQERLYAGGPNSVRGYNQNLLGPVVYIVGPSSIQDNVVVDSSTHLPRHQFVAYDTATIRQYSPTGGNTLAVGNLELRTPSPFLSNIVQLAFFADAGLVWNRPEDHPRLRDIRVTPGVGVRVNSPVGPFRVDVAYNKYSQQAGAVYVLDPNSRKLLCVSPDNPFDQGDIESAPGKACPSRFTPAQGSSFLNRLTFNFSIGQAF
ncbi:MAG TPA: BamA/TamA family outer membrane protein [Gemmatimonadaceae bacterium]|nr:BamA/TamA family outer membrane protein [Gemmatimonadaceae bacterium]